jgi:hypothetical protein
MTTPIFHIPARTLVATTVAPEQACWNAPADVARTSGNGTVLVEARTA